MTSMTLACEPVNGDQFILARFNLFCGTIVEYSNNSLENLLKEVPEHLSSDNDETLAVCEVFKWKHEDGESTPTDLQVLYQIEHYNDLSE